MGLRSSNVAAFVIGVLVAGVVGTGAAVAATGSLVNVADPTTGVSAKVSNSGRLLVSANDGGSSLTVDGTVGITGPVQVGDGDGPLTVDGTVGVSGVVQTRQSVFG